MNFYAASLNGLKHILHASGETRYENYIDECIKEWETNESTRKLEDGFRKNGIFEDFVFPQTDFATQEEHFWFTQLFGGMVAMTVQLARFHNSGRTITIESMRKNFGAPSDVISGTKCQNCGAKEINMTDIDKYVTPAVISKTIVDGLENGCLTEKLDEIMTLKSKLLSSARAEAIARALNSNVSVSDDRTPMQICKRCGSHDMAKCRFLRHTRQPSFVFLSR